MASGIPSMHQQRPLIRPPDRHEMQAASSPAAMRQRRTPRHGITANPRSGHVDWRWFRPEASQFGYPTAAGTQCSVRCLPALSVSWDGCWRNIRSMFLIAPWDVRRARASHLFRLVNSVRCYPVSRPLLLRTSKGEAVPGCVAWLSADNSLPQPSQATATCLNCLKSGTASGCSASGE
jgi:hypothetical protein